MTDTVSNPSRRVLLGALTAAPLLAGAGIAGLAMPPPDLAPFDPDPIVLRRTPDSPRLSRIRYECAHEFFPERDPRSDLDRHRFLYDSGVTAQLGLLSYLMAIGFDDDWCARQIGCRPAFTLDYANRYGFGYDRPDMTRLAALLSPYWQWNSLHYARGRQSRKVDFVPSEVRTLLHGLLAHVGRMTGQRALYRETAA